MIPRNGEGFTKYEQTLFADFLDDEIALRGLFLRISRRATLGRQSDVYTRVNDAATTRVLTRDFEPIVTPGLAQKKSKHTAILRDVKNITTQVVGAETTVTTDWYCRVQTRQGQEKTTDVRPTLTTWQYVGTPPLTKVPKLTEEDWTFADPGEVWTIIGDDIRHHEHVDRQTNTMLELKRLDALLRGRRA